MKEESKGNNFPLNLFHPQQEQGGTQRTLVDAAGQPLYTWDADDRATEIVYDELRRPLKRITNDKELERYIYGEGLVNDKVNNLRGQLYQHYDGSGLQQINIYDFKGNALETQQQLLEDATISDADWNSNPVLSTEVFTSAITFDALNRPITQTDPGGNVQAFTYDKGGLLETVKLNNENYVNDIHYDAKGQRQAIWYGNGTKTSYTYDVFTFRLRRLLIVNLNNNEILQDLNYWYDPVGNITEIQDKAQQTLFFNNAVIAPTQKFVYDAIYRLIEAKGRELIGTDDFGGTDNWNDAAWQTSHKGDGSAVQNYIQKYSYDEVGNILQLQHIANAGSYTRNYSYDVNSNKLLSTEVGSNTYSYSHDARGNMTEMPHLSSLAWNTQNELKSIMRGSEPTYYQYSNGERVRKHTVKRNIKEERIYLGSYEIYRKYVNNVLDIERTTMHVSDDTGRIAMLEVRTVGTDPSLAFLQRYIYSNHLQSASLELDENGAIISYEEYHPYGTKSYQAINAIINAVAKRYRYTGKERDEENGFYYHGARYYVPWLCRWTAVDPLEEERSWLSSYNFVQNNPLNRVDSTGMLDNPIYDEITGNLLGTDDKGLQGTAIVMNKNDFIQGMSHEDALEKDVGVDNMSLEAMNNLTESFISLPSRPDWDGYLTLEEANEWYRTGKGQPLFTDLSKIDLSGIYSLGEKYVGQVKAFNLLLNSGSLNDGLVYGNITLKRYPNHQVRAFADKYDFEMHNPWNPLNWGRNVETVIGRKVAGEGMPFEINIYGSATLKPLFPWTK